MSLDDEIRVLERLVLTGDEPALVRLKASWLRAQQSSSPLGVDRSYPPAGLYWVAFDGARIHGDGQGRGESFVLDATCVRVFRRGPEVGEKMSFLYPSWALGAETRLRTFLDGVFPTLSVTPEALCARPSMIVDEVVQVRGVETLSRTGKKFIRLSAERVVPRAERVFPSRASLLLGPERIARLRGETRSASPS